MVCLFGANSLAEEADKTAATGVGHQEEIIRTGRRGLLQSHLCVHGDSIGCPQTGGSAEFVNCAADFAGAESALNAAEFWVVRRTAFGSRAIRMSGVLSLAHAFTHALGISACQAKSLFHNIPAIGIPNPSLWWMQVYLRPTKGAVFGGISFASQEFKCVVRDIPRKFRAP